MGVYLFYQRPCNYYLYANYRKMRTLNFVERFIGTLYLVGTLLPLPFAGPPVLMLLSSRGGQYDFTAYVVIVALSLFFFTTASILARNIDRGQPHVGRRVRRLLYGTLIFIPVFILVMKIFYPQGNFQI